MYLSEVVASVDGVTVKVSGTAIDTVAQQASDRTFALVAPGTKGLIARSTSWLIFATWAEGFALFRGAGILLRGCLFFALPF